MENAFSPSKRVPIVLRVPELLKSPEIPLRPKANSQLCNPRKSKENYLFQGIVVQGYTFAFQMGETAKSRKKSDQIKTKSKHGQQ
jgi:hypothetical protein